METLVEIHLFFPILEKFLFYLGKRSYAALQSLFELVERVGLIHKLTKESLALFILQYKYPHKDRYECVSAGSRNVKIGT